MPQRADPRHHLERVRPRTAKPKVQQIYPKGIHQAIAAGLQQQLGDAIAVHTATLDEPEHGLTPQRLDETDVLLWWGHLAHDRVSDEVVQRAQRRVWEGHGLYCSAFGPPLESSSRG